MRVVASHHLSLHKSDEIPGVTNTVSDLSSCSYNVLLPIMKIATVSKRCKIVSFLWDAGADISFIISSKAKQLKLQGRPVTLYVTIAGGKKKA